jgi:hypothetical protein
MFFWGGHDSHDPPPESVPGLNEPILGVLSHSSALGRK